ncbi:MAG: hypothetical protein HC786_20700 [Richelia sp. CSU_2_1]|nr:hypothetical protein [Microcoleus sp. SU_5_6]NJR24395.1 hypothetical protein [Richelia sp. CSU_2_1]
MLNYLSAAFGLAGIQTQEYPNKRSLVFLLPVALVLALTVAVLQESRSP